MERGPTGAEVGGIFLSLLGGAFAIVVANTARPGVEDVLQGGTYLEDIAYVVVVMIGVASIVIGLVTALLVATAPRGAKQRNGLEAVAIGLGVLAILAGLYGGAPLLDESDGDGATTTEQLDPLDF